MKPLLIIIFLLSICSGSTLCQTKTGKGPGKCNDLELEQLNGKIKTMDRKMWLKAAKVNGKWMPEGKGVPLFHQYSPNGYIEKKIEDGKTITYSYEHANGTRSRLTKLQNGKVISESKYVDAGTDTLVELCTIAGNKEEKEDFKTTYTYNISPDVRVVTNMSTTGYIRFERDEMTYNGNIITHKYLSQTNEVTSITFTETVLQRDIQGNPTEVIFENEDATTLYQTTTYTYY